MGPDTGKMKDASLPRPFASLLTSVSRCVYLYLRGKAEKSFMLLCTGTRKIGSFVIPCV